MADPHAWGSPDAAPGPGGAVPPGPGGTGPDSGTGWAGNPGWGSNPGWSSNPGWGSGGPGYVAPYKPGVVPLRPLGVGEILDGAFASLRQNPGATFGLSALVIVVEQVLTLVLNLITRGATDGVAFAASYATYLVGAGGGLVLAGVLTPVVSEAVLGGRTARAQARERLRGRIPGLLGLALAIAVLTFFGLIAVVVGAVVMWVFLALATPAYVLERTGVRAAMRRSRELVRGSWWRTFGVLLLGVVVTGVVQAIVTVPLTIAGIYSGGISLSDQTATVSTTLLVVEAVVGVLVGTVVQPVAAGITVLLYIDQRMRREGLDVTLARSARARADEARADRPT